MAMAAGGGGGSGGETMFVVCSVRSLALVIVSAARARPAAVILFAVTSFALRPHRM